MNNDQIILIHGLLMNSLCMRPLGNKLTKLGYQVIYFNYPTLRNPLQDNREILYEFITKNHLQHARAITHSLGSLLIQATLNHYSDLKLKQIISIAPPFQGSQITQNLSEIHLGFIVGKAKNPLLPHQNHWTHPETPLGVIAGNHSAGISKFFISNDQPNDGTVYVEETKMKGMTDHIILPYSHTAILFSQPVAHQCHHFISHGFFDHQEKHI